MATTSSLTPSAEFREITDPIIFADAPTLDLPLDLPGLIERQSAVFAGLAGASQNRLVIMGTGFLGKILAERLQAFPVTVECFCDNDPTKQGGTLLGRPILSVPEAVERYNGRAAFVVGIYHGHAAEEQLRSLQCQSVVSAATLCRHCGPPMTPLYSFDFPAAIYEQRDEVERCAGLWADDHSRAEYRRVLQWFLADRQENPPRPRPGRGDVLPSRPLGAWRPGAFRRLRRIRRRQRSRLPGENRASVPQGHGLRARPAQRRGVRA